MESPSVSPPPAPTAQVVGNAFVDQYYHVLHHAPELGHMFYQDSSVLTRPEADGVMTSVTTLQAINEKILSLDYKDYKAEIETIDAQDSYKDGVLVLVTGYLTGRDNLRRKFTQSFFLAPQDKGYFVLNDVFRYVDENEPLETEVATIDGLEESVSAASLTQDPEPTYAPDLPVEDDPSTSPAELDLDGRAYDTPQNEGEQIAEVDVALETPVHCSENEVIVIELGPPIIQEDAQIKSYATIVKDMKGNTTPTPVYMETTNGRAVPVNAGQCSDGFPASMLCLESPESSAPDSNDASESGNAQEEVEGHSIYIRNMPLRVTVFQVEEEFKKFGPIKTGGVQVRNNKQQGFCFGFVEFDSVDSMHSAIQASPVTIGGRLAVVEEKKTKSRVGSGRGRSPLGGGWFHNDNFRDRRNFSGGRGYGNHEFGNRGYMSRQGRGPPQFNGRAYQ